MMRVDSLVREGIEGVTVRDIRANKAISLEDGLQAAYFSKIRDDMNSYASSRLMKNNKADESYELFKEIMDN